MSGVAVLIERADECAVLDESVAHVRSRNDSRTALPRGEGEPTPV